MDIKKIEHFLNTLNISAEQSQLIETFLIEFNEEIEELKTKIKDLKNKYDSLTRPPFVNPLPKSPFVMPDNPNPYIDQPDKDPWKWPKILCSKCSMDFSGVTGYCCGRSDCPIQPPITC